MTIHQTKTTVASEQEREPDRPQTGTLSRASHVIFTPARLADRWDCSERHVRNMIERGELAAFRLGEKLLRIRLEDVEAFECQNGDLQDCGENIASLGTKAKSEGGTTRYK